ncbi:1-aminocyclopropane-1-carboxylate deaminase/D-cysteine desulfhydrase [Methylibium sp.]|uniref:1-aminocyclopropane-1-carboxylate deaminase/D-cysteine desulfhydrase n=1 Tax=Methylibium sp. TaxID=2067992 RepID=UPI003D100E65
MNASAFDRLDALPRDRLGLTPTPVSAAPELARALGLRELWIKRDELIGFGLGGNKVRGLELLLADARAQSADTLVTGAGPQSNHVRATAAAAAYAGMDAVAVYWGNAPPAMQGNLKLTHCLGAKIRFTGSPDRAQVDEAIEAVAHELRAAGRRPYTIPRGGACALGVLGHVLAAYELHRQCVAIDRRPGTIVMAVGSGGTLAGWLLGTALLGANWRVEGVTVSRPAAEVRGRVVQLAAEAAALLDLPPRVEKADVVVHDGFIGAGYGVPSAAGDAAIVKAARVQGLFLDPTYTGKAFAGLCSLAELGRIDDRAPVVFIHTGGEPALFANGSTGLSQ